MRPLTNGLSVISPKSLALLCSWPRRIQGGFEALDTFERVVEVEWDCLYRAAIRAGADVQTAQDIVQEALLRAYQRLQRMHQNELAGLQVHWWLKSIIKRVAATYVSPDRDGAVPAHRGERGVFERTQKGSFARSRSLRPAKDYHDDSAHRGR